MKDDKKMKLQASESTLHL